MCGLVALLKPKNYSDPKSALSLALEVTKHRGLPGREGRYEDSHVGLGFNRLPIRGLSSAYDQPIYNIEENMVGMFVGEIFNTDWTNDAEYAFEVLRNHGPKGLTKCDGFWSIVKHDTKHHTTEVLTDHLAIKPLYWNRATGTIASELRAIEAIDRLSLNEHYLANVLKWGYDPMGQTPYEGVVKLKPGFHYQFKNGDLRSYHQYFPLRPTSGSLRKALTEATHGRLLSDIPVAVLCSGGLDSTIVALLAAQKAKDLTVFHIDNAEAEYFDAIQWPGNVKTVKLELEPTSLEEALVATEEPVDLGSVLPQYQLGQAVKKAGFNVVLSGDGADELFGGYGRAQVYDSQHSDIFSELVHYHLPRLDKTMMFSTVELRSPFLSPGVIELALSTPYPKRTAKQLLKENFSDIVPQKILERDKQPLKTKSVIEGGMVYRKRIIESFRRRHYD